MEQPRLRLVTEDQLPEREIPPFGRWLIGLARGVKTAHWVTVLLTSVGASVYGSVSQASYLATPKYLLPITSGAQCLVILVFIFLSRFSPVRGFASGETRAQAASRLAASEGCSGCAHITPENVAPIKEVATRAMRHYRNYWMILWLCWLLLYAVLTFMHLIEDEKLRVALKVAATFVNNGAALAMLYCYLTLSRPESLGVRSEKGEGQADWFIWVAILVMLTIAEAALVILAMAGKLPGWFATGPQAISNVFGWISGIGSTVIMFFYTRRLASRFMDCPTWIIVLLCVYAALQPGFGMIGHDNPKETVVLLNFALVLKTMLFLYMTWVFKYGWLLFYFSQIVQFKDSARSGMRSFSLHLD